MTDNPDDLPLRPQTPITLTYQPTGVPGEALFWVVAQLWGILAQEYPDLAREYENKGTGEGIFPRGTQLGKILAPKNPIIVPPSASHQSKQSRFLTYPELKSVKGIKAHSRTISRWEKADQFPQHIEISPGRKVWYEHEVDEWMRERAEARPLRVLNKRKLGI